MRLLPVAVNLLHRKAARVVDTRILKEADDNMINTYTLLAVNPEAPFTDVDGNPAADVAINTEGACARINWLLSEGGRPWLQTTATPGMASTCSI